MNRIDVHQHMVPPAYEPFAQSPRPAWSPRIALDALDDSHTAAAVLSLSAPGIPSRSDGGGPDLARTLNDDAAEVVKDHPRRFGFFAGLPMADTTDDTLAEIDHAFDELHADGVGLMTSYAGTYLGDPVYEPVWDALDARAATVFVHPTAPEIRPLPGVHPSVVDFPIDTTRAAADLVLSGTVARHPDVKIILAHAGGFLPYGAHHVAVCQSVLRTGNFTVRETEDLVADMRRFYVDTALSMDPTVLAALFEFTSPDHVLYGSDWPYLPAEAARYLAGLAEGAALTAADRDAVVNGSGELLFPRLAAA